MQKSISSLKQKAFLENLRRTREEAGLRQTDVAKYLGHPQSFVSKYESGERRLDLLELELVCEACNTDILEFVKRYKASS